MSQKDSSTALKLLKGSPMLKKHIATVHVEARLSELEHNIFNCLLHNAYPSLRERRVHTMRYTELCELIDYSSGDRQSIKNAIKKIAKIQIEWIDRNEKGKEISWEVYNYLSSAGVHLGSDTFSYGFDPGLAEHLHNPEIFAQINLIAQRQFNSKFSLYLYENCARYRENKGFPGKTPKWDIDIFRKFMGVADKKLYDRFAELNRRIIKPAMKEINAVSDIFLSVDAIKEGRNVRALQFKVEDNHANINQPQLPGVEDPVEMHNARENTVVLKCLDMGIGEGIAIKWLKEYGEAYILEKITMTEKQVRSDKIHSSVGGWLTRAIKNDYKDESQKLEYTKKQNRERARLARAEEYEKSENMMEKQRSDRQKSREIVANFVSSLDIIDREQFEIDFVRESNLDPNEIEAFHDWIAEKQDLGNPYPALRVKRMQSLIL